MAADSSQWAPVNPRQILNVGLGQPGFFFFLGAPPKGKDFKTAPSNHSPLFDIDEDQLPVGARTLAALAVDFLQRK